MSFSIHSGVRVLPVSSLGTSRPRELRARVIRKTIDARKHLVCASLGHEKLAQYANDAVTAVQTGAPSLLGDGVGAKMTASTLGESLYKIAPHMPLATGVGLPCTVMNCGDVTYRSTLDRKLRLEEEGISPIALAIVTVVSFYLLALQPGVFNGFLDFYIIAPLDRATRPRFKKRDFILDKKLGTGGFGVVYQAQCDNAEYMKTLGTKEAVPVVVKKATEYGVEEAWMNERARRACAGSCADFVDAFEDTSAKGKPLWLIWRFEGASTLADQMAKKEFPYNLEKELFGRALDLPVGQVRESAIIKTAAVQMCEALNSLHRTGIVHRDIKPQNVVISEAARRLKLIDLGAAADLRVGINYVPREFLLDPRYCAPERFIMSTRTAQPPPEAIAALLSPILWQLNRPDKFDTYAIGLIVLQMAFPALRSDGNLIAFRRSLEVLDFDLREWRRTQFARRPSKEMQAGFDLLDLNNGAGWEFVCLLMEKRPSQRMSAKDALKHRWIVGEKETSAVVRGLDTAILGDGAEWQGWLLNNMAKNGTDRAGGFTEGQLEEMGYKGRIDDNIVSMPNIFVKRLARTVARVKTLDSKRLRPGLNFWKGE